MLRVKSILKGLIDIIIGISEKIFGRCGHCGEWFVYPKKRRMNTAYVDEESNWVTEWDWSFEQTESNWEERWKDYYSDRI
jgi:hypothetical protein